MFKVSGREQAGGVCRYVVFIGLSNTDILQLIYIWSETWIRTELYIIDTVGGLLFYGHFGLVRPERCLPMVKVLTSVSQSAYF